MSFWNTTMSLQYLPELSEEAEDGGESKAGRQARSWLGRGSPSWGPRLSLTHTFIHQIFEDHQLSGIMAGAEAAAVKKAP